MVSSMRLWRMAAMCRAMADAGYDMFVGHEFSPVGDTGDALRQAYDIRHVT